MSEMAQMEELEGLKCELPQFSAFPAPYSPYLLTSIETFLQSPLVPHPLNPPFGEGMLEG